MFFLAFIFLLSSSTYWMEKGNFWKYTCTYFECCKVQIAYRLKILFLTVNFITACSEKSLWFFPSFLKWQFYQKKKNKYYCTLFFPLKINGQKIKFKINCCVYNCVSMSVCAITLTHTHAILCVYTYLYAYVYTLIDV